MKDFATSELNAAQLRYLGQMAAHVSHELRNNLATINEKNGLISDLIALAARGRPINEARVGQLASDVARRVQDATEVCERLSKLAHSPDHDIHVVELGGIVALVASFFRRPASVASVTFEPLNSDSVNVEVNPVLLQLAISQVFDWVLRERRQHRITLDVGRVDRKTAFVRFSGADWSELLETAPTPLSDALVILDARLQEGDEEHELLLVVPSAQKGEAQEGLQPEKGENNE